MLTPEEARSRLERIREDMKLPELMYGGQIGPQADLFRVVEGLLYFLEDALA